MPLSLKILIAAVMTIIVLAGISFVLFQGVGLNYLRQRVGEELTPLFQGETQIDEAQLSFRGGLWLVASGVSVYPTESGPGMSARRISARVGILPLLAGRFRLHTLLLEGFHLEITRSLQDEIHPPPVAALRSDKESPSVAQLEDGLAGMRALDKITRILLTLAFIADNIELQDSSVRWLDAYSPGPFRPPVDLRIEKIEGILEERWLGQEMVLELRGNWIDPRGIHAQINVAGHRASDDSQTLDVEIVRLRLDPLRSYLQSRDPRMRIWRAGGLIPTTSERPLTGLLDGNIHYKTERVGHGRLEVEWTAKDFDAGFAWGNERLRLDSPHADLRLALEIEPERARLDHLKFKGEFLEIAISGHVDRPLVNTSPASLDVQFSGVGIDAIRRIAVVQSPELRASMVGFLDQLESGTIERIGAKGLAPLEDWTAVLSGKKLRLPADLALTATVSDVRLKQQAPGERVTGISGTLTWVEERLEVVTTRGLWDGRRLPLLNLSIDGFSNLLGGEQGYDPTRARGKPLPGLLLFDDIFASDPKDPDRSTEDEIRQPLEVHLEIDTLDHPTLRWRVEDASLDVIYSDGRATVEVTRGHWGSGEIKGNFVWQMEGEERIDAKVEIFPYESPAPPTPGERARASRGQPISTEWARGRIHLLGLPPKIGPIAELTGAFRFDDTQMSLTVNQSPLSPKGRLDGLLAFELGRDDFVEVVLDLKGQGADADRVTNLFGFPKGFASGELDLEANLFGILRPGSKLFAEIDGTMELHAKNGDLDRSIPLAARLAHASEGLNPRATGDVIRFETLEASVRFKQGRLTADEFKLEGPLRIFMNGDFDIARPGKAINAEVGVFLFRQVDQLLGRVPLIKRLIPGGSDKGLFGAYFEIRGTIDEPQLQALAIKSLVEGLPVPDLVKAPFAAIHGALSSKPGVREHAREEQKREPARAETRVAE